MSRERRSERDLFGEAEREDGDELVDVVLVHVDQTPRAWLLRRSGKPNSTRWAPKSLVSRGEPPHQDVFEMPRWVARDRGWL